MKKQPEKEQNNSGIKGQRFGPFFMGEKDGCFFIKNILNKDEHKALMKNLANLHGKYPVDIKAAGKEVENIISKYNPLDIIANMIITNLFYDPETYKEYSFEGRQAFVEYISLLCLKKTYHRGKEVPVTGKEVNEIHQHLDKIFRFTLWFYATEYINLNSSQPLTALEKLRWEAISRFLNVRYPGYFHHLEELLLNLFQIKSTAEWMQKNIGFSIECAIQCTHSIMDLMNNKIQKKKELIEEEITKISNNLKHYNSSNVTETNKCKEMLSYLSTLPMHKQEDELKKYSIYLLFQNLGATFSFTGYELTSISKCKSTNVSSFLDLFTINFGEVDRNFYMPEPVHLMQRKSIIKHPTGFLCPSPQLLFWALKPRIEEKMKQDIQFWHNYENHRHDFLLQESLRLFKTIFHSKATIYQKLKYKENELDGLVIFDRTCLLIEVKGGELTPRSKKGFFDRIKRDVDSLITEAHEQTLKAKNYIKDNQRPIFKQGHELWKFPKKNIDKFILVTVTLEPLDVFITNISQLKNIGFLTDNDLPWAVSYLDLKVISELVEFPTQLLHYLKRRLRINELGNIEAHDELDWFMCYLTEGLYFENKPHVDNSYQLLTYTTELDDFYLYQTGQRKTPAPKPRQEMPTAFKQLILILEEKGGNYYTEVIQALLDMNDTARNQFIEMYTNASCSAKKDNRIHDFTMTIGNGKTGFTWFVVRDSICDKYIKRLQYYSKIKKYQLKADKWCSFLTVTDHSDDIIHGWLYNSDPWQYDSTMETELRIFQEMKANRASTDKKKIRRNDPCPCGSGLKYKKCCGRIKL